MACLGAIEELGLPLTRIVHAEVWATDTIPADLPPMIEFKAKADKIIRDWWGIEVEHTRSKWTYEAQFYEKFKKGVRAGEIYGFAMTVSPWCNSRLKACVLDNGFAEETIKYLGIAADEPNRFHNLNDVKRSPLVEAGWTEEMCRDWCEKNDLLSPIYTASTRGGCWFCHNQGVEQLRKLRKEYPHLWRLLLKWDKDSPVSFKPNGHTVHDFDRRFALEDEGLLEQNDNTFRWSMLDAPLQYKMKW